MNAFLRLTSLFTFVLALAGCTQSPSGRQGKENKVKANLAKLGDEDQKAAEEQKYCVVETENELGAMGAPIKIMIKDEPVFVCCKSCVDEAKKHPDETLAKVKEFKAKAEKPSSK
ncbi:MAG TPA: hypothetical protein VGZ25_16680 [Gemmataceae bacterium]|nr:hypothetical protein [Gemmataceae bacterium]